MKKALVDLGSNTIRLSVYQVADDKKFRLLFSQKEMAGLVNYVSDKKMSCEGFDKACTVINNFKSLLWQFDIDNVNIFATASLRNIENSDEAVEYIKTVTGEDVEIISGKTEAELGYYGALSDTDIKSGSILDIGGGSTEIVDFRNKIIQSAESYEIGSLNLFNGYVKELWPNDLEEKDIKAKIKDSLSVADNNSCDIVCGIGGTNSAVLSLVNAYYKKPYGNNEITSDEFKKIKKVVLKRDDTAKKLILKNCPDRIHTIIPGMMITDEILKKFGSSKMIISRNGVREGYLCQKII